MLVLGALLWLGGAVLTPGELRAAKRREPIHARTAIALLAYLGGAVFTLAGLPRRPPHELPSR